jgi:Fe-S oxidoreductase
MAANTPVTCALQVLEKQLNRPLATALEVCARCGICAESCHYYVAEPTLEHVPAYRAEQLRQVYRRKHDFFGRFFPAWVKAKDLDETTLERLAEIAFSECTLCRRCTFNCPMGVDTPLMMRAVRGMATAAGKAPEILEMLADAAIEKGNDPGMFRDLFVQQIGEMEKDLQTLVGDSNAHITVERPGARVLYVALAGAHTILPPAAVFYAAKEDWTLSIYEAANYGVFLGDTGRAKQIAARIIDEAKALHVQEVIVAECGHACASLVWDAPNWFGETFPFRVRSIVELFAEYIEQGRLKLDPTANPESITYHDSCNLARTSGIYREPRTILNAVAQNFQEMTPHGLENYCCGGGGGLVALPEYDDKRMRAGKPKVDQIRKTGAQIVAAACENCRLQLGDLNTHYQLNVEITALADLIVKALRFPQPKPEIIPGAHIAVPAE